MVDTWHATVFGSTQRRIRKCDLAIGTGIEELNREMEGCNWHRHRGINRGTEGYNRHGHRGIEWKEAGRADADVMQRDALWTKTV